MGGIPSVSSDSKPLVHLLMGGDSHLLVMKEESAALRNFEA